MESEVSAKELAVLERDYSVLANATDIALDSSKDKDSKIKEWIDSIEDNRLQLGNLSANWYETVGSLLYFATLWFKCSLKGTSSACGYDKLEKLYSI